MDRREFLAAAAAPLVLGAVPAALAGSRGGTPLSLSEGTLCAFSQRGVQLHELRVSRSSHDACFIVGT